MCYLNSPAATNTLLLGISSVKGSPSRPRLRTSRRAWTSGGIQPLELKGRQGLPPQPGAPVKFEKMARAGCALIRPSCLSFQGPGCGKGSACIASRLWGIAQGIGTVPLANPANRASPAIELLEAMEAGWLL